MQMIFGILLFVISVFWMKPLESKPVNPSDTAPQQALNYNALTDASGQNSSQKPFNPSVYILLLSFFPFFAGLTGKCITSKCLKYGEVITKIRV